MPSLIANTIGFFLAWTLILIPISVIIWAITLALTFPRIKEDTARANAEATADYQRRVGGP